MKTYTNLFDEICEMRSLYDGYVRSRRGKRHQPDLMRFEQNLEGNLLSLQRELKSGRYRTSPYHTFYIHEPKKRMVAALPIRDRVVQQSLVGVIEPIYEPRMIHHSFACRPGKGIHAGAHLAQQWIRKLARGGRPVYALKADISKYFASVDHETLARILSRRIRCARTFSLCRSIIDSYAPGIPVGNLTSQLWANVYLDHLDQHVKHELRVRYYMRYMDDFIVLGNDKHALHALRQHLGDWLGAELRLRLNQKTQVFPVGPHALDFLGYRIWATHMKVRRRTLRKMRQTLRRLRAAYASGLVDAEKVQAHINSWLGHVCHADSFHSRQRVLASTQFWRQAS